MKRILIVMLAAVALIGVGGCLVVPDGHGGMVVVGAGHICSGHCDHYYHGGHWYSGHRHGHGCGHVLRGGMWVRIN